MQERVGLRGYELAAGQIQPSDVVDRLLMSSQGDVLRDLYVDGRASQVGEVPYRGSAIVRGRSEQCTCRVQANGIDFVCMPSERQKRRCVLVSFVGRGLCDRRLTSW